MGDSDNCPVLITCKKLKSLFNDVQEIQITSDNFSLGRGLNNSVVIPFLAISRNHCIFKKAADNNWMVEDNSSYGIKINGQLLGKGRSKTLSDGDTIALDQTEEFVYKYRNQLIDVFEIPRKRMKMEENDTNENNIINNMKLKFEESQSHELEHIEQKLKNVKHMQTTSMVLKKQLQIEMNNKIKQLETDFTLQIENLKGEKNEIEKQKALLLEERDTQLATIKTQMDEKIMELMEQVQKHNETETELLKENSSLKEKLEKEREEFLAELSRENSSKQDMLEKLEARIREQEEVRAKEREEALELLHKEVEKLKKAKEKQIEEIQEQKKKREAELKHELDNLRDNLEEKVLQTEQDKLKTEQLLNEQLEQMKKLSDEEKMKIDELMKEREEIQMKLTVAQTNAAKSMEELAARVTERETELAALAAERIQKQAEQSSEVISTLQEQLEKVKTQLQEVETERNTILENICAPVNGESSSKQTVLSEVGEIMESELQCSICAELFVASTTLNCSHTFCKYCITMWKKKKKDCPICRAPITSECKSLVLDTFIEKMVQNLSEEMKEKRKNILKDREASNSITNYYVYKLTPSSLYTVLSGVHRLFSQGQSCAGRALLQSSLQACWGTVSPHDSNKQRFFVPGAVLFPPLTELESKLAQQTNGRTNRGRSSSYGSEFGPEYSDYFDEEEGEEEQEYDYSYIRRRRYYDTDDSDGGSYDDSFSESDGTSQPGENNGATSTEPGSAGAATNSGTRRRGIVEGIPGSYYGGYGRCYRCGARGHWAPGCPLSII